MSKDRFRFFDVEQNAEMVEKFFPGNFLEYPDEITENFSGISFGFKEIIFKEDVPRNREDVYCGEARIGK